MEGNTAIFLVLGAIVAMVAILISDRMRPGLVLFSVVVLFLCTGILSPEEAVAGFSNKGMITVALLFLVSEGVRRSDALGHVIRHLLPTDGRKYTVRRGYVRLLPMIASVSAFLNNTPVVVVFAPIIKAWARKVGLPLKQLLIPLSYATILGGMCTLIGTSTNLVVHGMMLDAGLEGLSMFELAKVGVPVALLGLLYLYLFGPRRLPGLDEEVDAADPAEGYRVEALLGSRFPGIGQRPAEFDFKSHYGAQIVEIRRSGEPVSDLEDFAFREGDTLLLDAAHSFLSTWRDSRVFLLLTNGIEEPGDTIPRWKKYTSLVLLTLMIAGATFGSLPAVQALLPGVKLDMFFWVCIVTVLMAFLGIFPVKRYTKFISWDVLITIACALAISRAMTNSGLAEWLAGALIGISENVSPWVVLAMLYLTTNLITEVITNNAAAAFAFPVAIAAAEQLGVNVMPFVIAVCIASSASFSSPIGYQTNLIVQGLGNYRFGDFLRAGLPLNLLVFAVSMALIPLLWPF